MTTKTDITQARAAVEADRQGRMPSDAEMKAWGQEEEFFLFCDPDEFLDIVKSALARYGSSQPAASAQPTRCEDCPPVGYPTDETRCAPCDRRSAPVAQEPVSVTERWQDGDDSNMVSRVETAAPVAAQDQPVPEGWKLVPKVPTTEMLDAARKWQHTEYVYDEYAHHKFYQGIYSAMLAATPVAAQAHPWQALAAAMYQAAGAYDMPVRILDALSAAANGEPFAHLIDGLLPVECPEVSAQAREDAERYLWATANEDNAEVLNSIVICYDGDQAKINERVDVYRDCTAREAKEQP